jgi:hypothetical protein
MRSNGLVSLAPVYWQLRDGPCGIDYAPLPAIATLHGSVTAAITELPEFVVQADGDAAALVPPALEVRLEATKATRLTAEENGAATA